MEEYYDIQNTTFSHPFTYIIAGGTQSGKTTMVKKIVKHLDELISPRIDDILICYKEHQPAYGEMQLADTRVRLKKGLELDIPSNQNSLIIIDDQMSDSLKAKEVQELFTSGVHHRSISVIFLSQNLLPQGKYSRDIRLNTHYISICKTPSFSSQVCYISRQLYPKKPSAVYNAYEKATSQPYTSLFLNLHPNCHDQLRIQSGILPGEDHLIYQPL